MWLLTAGVDGNEYDDFGFIHGMRDLPDDFTPRPVYYALQNTNALFSDTKFDPTIRIEASDIPNLRRQGRSPFLRYGFRNKNGKAIVAYWIAAHSVPGGAFAPLTVNLKLVARASAIRYWSTWFLARFRLCNGRPEPPTAWNCYLFETPC